jgi:uncharacterized protein YjbI with pentapeptide repeats
LRQADFTDAVLTHCDFTDADLSQARFANAKLVGCNFSGANLSNVFWEPEMLSKNHFDSRTRFPAGYTPTPSQMKGL